MREDLEETFGLALVRGQETFAQLRGQETFAQLGARSGDLRTTGGDFRTADV